MYGQVRQVVANRFGVDLRLRAFLLADEVLEEAARPIRVATLGAIGVVSGSDAQPQLLQSSQRDRTALLVHDRAGGTPVPIRSIEEVDEVDLEGLFCLALLPVRDLA